jgi:DnaJ-domain-containing protein 1
MINLLYGAAAVALIWWLAKLFSKSNPAVLVKGLKMGGGIAALGVAAILGLRGRIDMALLLGMAGASLLGWGGFRLPGIPQRTMKSPGSTSRVRSAMIEMELDHDTGEMRGTVLAGAFAGRSLDSLNREDLSVLVRDCLASDPDGARLLEAYLDRRFPGWRVDAEGHGDPRPGRNPQPGAMTEQEAYEILGLQPGASADEIRAAHRTLMKKLHPDQGGPTYLATRVNQAKDVLLNRHR